MSDRQASSAATPARHDPYTPECRYCREDAVGVDAMGRPACQEHIDQVADDLGLEAS